ncbi:hypothetical protein EON76_00615 [bacterium]|nr:MAG: hypothetical protein EON76_00615 [bacterium]
MWDTNQLPTTGNFSLRKIAVSFLAVMLSAFLFAIIHHSTAFAADVTWQGDNLQYNGKTYSPESETIPGIPAGSTVYSSKSADSTMADIIYYPSNTDTSKEFSVQQAQVSLNGGQYTSPGPPSTVSVDAKSVKEKTQCDIPGIGWMICPLSRFIATGMDNIFGIIASYLKVEPLTDDKESGLYSAWKIGLSFANLCFIIAFLVIIYSQITSQSINNYNIKKMIPRLIVAAILVNVSYYICALAVDLSNIAGFSIQQALIDIRKSLPGDVGINMDTMKWQNITEYVLSGGTIIAAGFAGKAAFLGGAATGGTISSLGFLLFPILVAAALAVLVVLLVLAARQALITVLIVISPLAFVAYLLPNTEKWFEKWKDLFMTMLMVFPLFSLLFGGSQLASAIIMQNASQLSVIIFAMFIQVAPLVITPFLIKFSGSLLGRLAGMVNNPQKGLIDRSRNWAKDRAEVQRAEGLKRAANGGGTRWQRKAYDREKDKLHREGRKKDAIAHVDAGWHNDARYSALHESGNRAEMMKQVGETSAERHFESIKTTDRNLQRLGGQRRLNQDAIKVLQTKDDAAWEEAKSKDMVAGNRFAEFNTRAINESMEAQATAYQAGTAQAMQRIEYAKRVVVDGDFAKQAGGIDVEGGADSARSSALAALKKSQQESIAEGRALAQHFNLSSGQRQALARGEVVEGKNDDGLARTFSADNKYVRMAAVEDQVMYGTIEERQELIMRTGQQRELYEMREIVSEAMVKGNIGQTANYLGGKTIDDVRRGEIKGKSDLLRAAATSIAKGKLSAEQLLNQDKTSMETIVEAVKQISEGQIHLDGEYAQGLSTELTRLFESTETAMSDTRINVRLGERVNPMTELRDIGRAGTPYTNPTGPPPPSTP